MAIKKLLLTTTVSIFSTLVFATSPLVTVKPDSTVKVREFFHAETLYGDSENGANRDCFELPIDSGINWEALARQYYANINLDKPEENPETYTGSQSGEPAHIKYLRYEAELPPSVKSSHWLAISLQGVVEIVPTQLTGRVLYDYEWNQQENKIHIITPPEFEPGEACFTYTQKGKTLEDERTLFAVAIAPDEKFEKILLVVSAAQMNIHVKDQNVLLTLPNSPLNTAPRYSFSIGSDLYLLVSWPEQGGCLPAYDLFKVENGSAVEVIRTGGGCD